MVNFTWSLLLGVGHFFSRVPAGSIFKGSEIKGSEKISEKFKGSEKFIFTRIEGVQNFVRYKRRLSFIVVDQYPQSNLLLACLGHNHYKASENNPEKFKGSEKNSTFSEKMLRAGTQEKK